MKLVHMPFIFIISLNLGCASVRAGFAQKPCVMDADHYAQRAAELQAIVKADQDDRSGSPDSINWMKVGPRDLQRRMLVAEIFAEGCFREAQDYTAAALVFQHGDTADHFYQTFIWSKRAVDLGDTKQRWLMAAGLDRFLIRSGQRQLFATQGGKNPGSSCWCLEPVENTFPDTKRTEYTLRTLDQSMIWINSLNAEQSSCGKSQYCQDALRPSPAGTVPGFW